VNPRDPAQLELRWQSSIPAYWFCLGAGDHFISHFSRLLLKKEAGVDAPSIQSQCSIGPGVWLDALRGAKER